MDKIMPNDPWFSPKSTVGQAGPAIVQQEAQAPN